MEIENDDLFDFFNLQTTVADFYTDLTYTSPIETLRFFLEDIANIYMSLHSVDSHKFLKLSLEIAFLFGEYLTKTNLESSIQYTESDAYIREKFFNDILEYYDFAN
jgi:hypothetical protein